MEDLAHESDSRSKENAQQANTYAKMSPNPDPLKQFLDPNPLNHFFLDADPDPDPLSSKK
uniref:Uncharacterized protein n=1 Tax=Romanomermis culicivorax TaxID=13658 RepID=A0A915I7G3_ROMCU